MKSFNANWLWMIMSGLILPACVTINIYFPAAAAEKAADKIIDEVWQIDQSKQPDAKPSAETPAK